jgi:hypothetical protein
MELLHNYLVTLTRHLSLVATGKESQRLHFIAPIHHLYEAINLACPFENQSVFTCTDVQFKCHNLSGNIN